MSATRQRVNGAGRPVGERTQFYRTVLERLHESGVPYLVGGAYGLACVTGITPRTKDLDLFLRREDCARAREALEAAGFATELPFPHWLAKVRRGRYVIDLIFNSGNGQSPVDDQWFAHAFEATVCGIRVRVCPIEEMIWTKAFVMERERYDGADVAHLLHAAERIDWPRLLARFGDDSPVLLTHLILYTYIYPGDATRVPRTVSDELLRQWGERGRSDATTRTVCRGGLLSRAQYVIDMADHGYDDERLRRGNLRPEELRIWTDAAPDVPRTARRRSAAPCSRIGGERDGHLRASLSTGRAR